VSRANVARWSFPRASLVRSDGPARVVYDDPAPEGWTPPRLLGFHTPPAADVDPLLWEGDDG